MQAHDDVAYPNAKQRVVLRAELLAKSNRARIAELSDGFAGGACAYCFVDLTTGDILKPGGWDRPAKGVRGNILGAEPLAGCERLGVISMKDLKAQAKAKAA
jgi:hypothetical protein